MNYDDFIDDWNEQWEIENGVKSVCVYCGKLCKNVMDTVCDECEEALDD